VRVSVWKRDLCSQLTTKLNYSQGQGFLNTSFPLRVKGLKYLQSYLKQASGFVAS
jgi:hypothetical protein